MSYISASLLATCQKSTLYQHWHCASLHVDGLKMSRLWLQSVHLHYCSCKRIATVLMGIAATLPQSSATSGARRTTLRSPSTPSHAETKPGSALITPPSSKTPPSCWTLGHMQTLAPLPHCLLAAACTLLHLPYLLMWRWHEFILGLMSAVFCRHIQG